MKSNFSREWCLRMAQREAEAGRDAQFGVGELMIPPVVAQDDGRIKEQPRIGTSAPSTEGQSSGWMNIRELFEYARRARQQAGEQAAYALGGMSGIEGDTLMISVGRVARDLLSAPSDVAKRWEDATLTIGRIRRKFTARVTGAWPVGGRLTVELCAPSRDPVLHREFEGSPSGQGFDLGPGVALGEVEIKLSLDWSAMLHDEHATREGR